MAGDGQCPICGKTFPVKLLNSHANACLGDSEETRPSSDSPDIAVISISQPSGQSNKRKSDDRLAWDKIFSQAKRSKLDETICRPQKFSSSAGCAAISETVIEKLSFAERLSHPISPGNMAFVKKTDSNNDTENGSPGTKNAKLHFAPLPERMRPVTLEEYIGQEQAVGKQSLLRSILKTASIPSLVFWGPPGCGKVLHA